MAKRQRVDSTAAAIDVIESAGAVITAPSNVPLTDSDMPFFVSVIAEFARSEWTAHSLELAAMLARTMADLELDQRLMREEGATLRTDKGTPVVNPRKSVIQMNAGIVLNYRRSLSLHARAQGGEARDVGNRRKQTKEIEGGSSSDNLLARRN